MKYISCVVAIAAVMTSVQAQNTTAASNGTVDGTSTVLYSSNCPTTTAADVTISRAAVATSAACNGTASFTAVPNNGTGSGTLSNGTVTYTTTQKCPVCPVETASIIAGTTYLSGSAVGTAAAANSTTYVTASCDTATAGSAGATGAAGAGAGTGSSGTTGASNGTSGYNAYNGSAATITPTPYEGSASTVGLSAGVVGVVALVAALL